MKNRRNGEKGRKRPLEQKKSDRLIFVGGRPGWIRKEGRKEPAASSLWDNVLSPDCRIYIQCIRQSVRKANKNGLLSLSHLFHFCMCLSIYPALSSRGRLRRANSSTRQKGRPRFEGSSNVDTHSNRWAEKLFRHFCQTYFTWLHFVIRRGKRVGARAK